MRRDGVRGEVRGVGSSPVLAAVYFWYFVFSI